MSTIATLYLLLREKCTLLTQWGILSDMLSRCAEKMYKRAWSTLAYPWYCSLQRQRLFTSRLAIENDLSFVPMVSLGLRTQPSPDLGLALP